MNDTKKPEISSRREFLSTAAGASALAGVALPHVHAAENNTVQLALVGCGGRGTGAAVNALSTKAGPVKLVAMADVFPQRLNDSYDKLKSQFAGQVEVPPERRFLGYEAYQQAMDALKPGDVVILGTPPAFRWVHFKKAIDKGVHCFMEKPITVDGPTTKKMFELSDLATKKNLKVGVGLMVRHCRARQELLNRLKDGAIGDIVSMRAYRMGQGGGTAGPKPPNLTEVQWQVQRFHAFLWASGGVFSDYYIHQIDECSWMKGAWPVEAHGLGARQYRGDSLDQNFDVYHVEYVFPDGSRLFFDGRNMKGARDEFASYAHGSKGSAVISTLSHAPGMTRIYKGHKIPRVLSRKDLPLPEDPNLAWAFPQPEKSPYQWEWDDLMEAIRQDKPYNEARRGAEASLVTSMGRMAAHTGQIVTYDQMLNCPHEMAPNVDKLTVDGPAPLTLGPDGKYPVPQP
ncbi:MAG TPA: streptomycin biosynthesis protein StrI, partial [Solibacterales bacterium]|nr:streptomycin biosynthesis protein StrI [Bryobacterales bacterium]